MNVNNIILMKYGVHASENVDSIITRKMEEISKTGRMFWGYGGCICHPKTQVQKFLKENFNRGERTYLLLVKTESQLHNTPVRMECYSEDGCDWKKIPEEINVLGSKYAITCNSFNSCNFDLNLSSYKVAVGNSVNKSLAEYMRGRVDKACGILNPEQECTAAKIVNVSYWGEVCYPGAVFCK